MNIRVSALLIGTLAIGALAGCAAATPGDPAAAQTTAAFPTAVAPSVTPQATIAGLSTGTPAPALLPHLTYTGPVVPVPNCVPGHHKGTVVFCLTN